MTCAWTGREAISTQGSHCDAFKPSPNILATGWEAQQFINNCFYGADPSIPRLTPAKILAQLSAYNYIKYGIPPDVGPSTQDRVKQTVGI